MAHNGNRGKEMVAAAMWILHGWCHHCRIVDRAFTAARGGLKARPRSELARSLCLYDAFTGSWNGRRIEEASLPNKGLQWGAEPPR